jgi:YVTN family beta-propeller protein
LEEDDKDKSLYISGGYDQKIYRYNNKFEPPRKYPVNGYAAGLAPIDKDHIAVVYLVVGKTGQGMLAILNTETGVIEHEVEAGYFPHTIRYLEEKKKLYVTVLGEDKLKIYNSKGIFIKSLDVGKTPQDICLDPKDNLLYVVNTGSDYLSVIDTREDEVLEDQRIYVGKDPVIDELMPKTYIQSNSERFGCGPTSCAVDAANPDRLFVTLAYRNAVGIFAKKDGKLLGYIPTAWYPTKVIPGNDWVAVLSAKGIHARKRKGKGPWLARRPNRNGPQSIWRMSNEDEYVLRLLTGTLGIIPRVQIETNQADWRKQVEEGAPTSEFGKAMPENIRYVFFIVRENRSYDQVLGDLGKGDGDPFLTLFGDNKKDNITPNAHALANQFVTLDNYYANGEISVLGHSYTTSGYASPFMEWLGNITYSGRYDSYPFGSVPAVCSPKYLWDELEKKNINYRIYGENYFLYTRAYRIIQENFGPDCDQAKQFYEQMLKVAADLDRGNELYMFYQAHHFSQPGTVKEAQQLLDDRPEVARAISEFLLGKGNYSLAEPPERIDKNKLRVQLAEYLYHYPIAYRSWDLNYSDLDRVRVWKADFENQIKQIKQTKHGHEGPHFQYIWLPNDHTAGTDKDALSPYQLVAQNDAALGIIINTIQNSPIWKESLILVTEDDAQNGPDHVDATRTVALAVGPWVKRGKVVSTRYDQLSMLRTIELLLGLDPLNQNDALAVPMFDIFDDHFHKKRYEMPKPSDKLVEADAVRYKRLFEDEKKKP